MFDKIFTLSNGLSLLRLFLAIPLFLLIGVEGAEIWLVLLVIVGVLTDYLDGYFARKFNEISELGKIIDPIADKVCIAAILMKLYLIGRIDPIVFYILIFRDLLIVVVAAVVSRYIKLVLPSTMTGKVTVNIIAVYLLMATFLSPEWQWLVSIGAVISIAASAITLVEYGIRAVKALKG